MRSNADWVLSKFSITIDVNSCFILKLIVIAWANYDSIGRKWKKKKKSKFKPLFQIFLKFTHV